ncbi:MAG: hypothetical protein Q4G63_03295 [Bacteroidia bacterium]|nr:hypothetical protein [Bacteroidia bacterium]
MKINIYLKKCLLSLFSILLLIGCKKEEVLQKQHIDFVRFEFPQGNTNEDKQIEEIAKKYGVYIIYKNLKPKDYDNSWQLPAADVTYHITDLSTENLPTYIDLIEHRILESFDQRVMHKVLPIYVFLTDSLYTMTLRSRMPPGTTELEYYYVRSDDYDIRTTGMDYWAFCIPKSKFEDADFLKSYQCRVAFEVIMKMMNNGYITRPSEFATMANHTTPPLERLDKNSPNYYLKRGFVDLIEGEFEGFRAFHPWYVQNDDGDFLSFVKIMIYLTKEEFDAKYPPAEYPFLHQRYNLLYEHFLVQNLDVHKIANNIQSKK